MRSRAFLDAVITICHRAVVTPSILAEWDRHQSTYFRHWRAAMHKKSKLLAVPADRRPKLRARILEANFGTAQRAPAEKDVHLVEAALAADKIVCSLESEAPELFARVAERYEPISEVAWANPGSHADALRSWLEEGAPIVK